MKKISDIVATRKKFQSEFLKRYAIYHIPWMKELISAYKERGRFPLFPTFIAEYYEDVRDKELSIIATLCLNWDKDALSQVKALRRMMGDHPYEWFMSRGFVVMSIGKNQEMMLMDGRGRKYWKMAQFFSMLYDQCNGRSLRSTFPAGKSSDSMTKLVNFALSVEERIGYSGCEYKAEVIELVLRASDGFSLGLWMTDPCRLRCPSNGSVNKFLKVWFPDFNTKSWSTAEAVRIFGLERDYDFFYFYLAWEDLKKSNKDGCVRYSTRYVSRYNGGYLMSPVFWTGKRGLIPKIEFLDD